MTTVVEYGIPTDKEAIQLRLGIERGCFRDEGLDLSLKVVFGGPEIAARYDARGRDAVMKLFPQVMPDEHTHPNRAGAELNAEFVIAGLKALTPNPLAQYYSAKAAGVK